MQELLQTINQSDYDAEIGKRIIKEKHPELADVDVVFLRSDKEKKIQNKLILGQCIKVNENYKWCCPYDFMIVLYEPNIAYFTDEQRAILIEHELLHIGITEGKQGNKYFVKPHDIEEFNSIIEEFGLRWAENG